MNGEKTCKQGHTPHAMRCICLEDCVCHQATCGCEPKMIYALCPIHGNKSDPTAKARDIAVKHFTSPEVALKSYHQLIVDMAAALKAEYQRGKSEREVYFARELRAAAQEGYNMAHTDREGTGGEMSLTNHHRQELYGSCDSINKRMDILESQLRAANELAKACHGVMPHAENGADDISPFARDKARTELKLFKDALAAYEAAKEGK